jgi:hypothetical protein
VVYQCREDGNVDAFLAVYGAAEIDDAGLRVEDIRVGGWVEGGGYGEEVVPYTVAVVFEAGGLFEGFEGAFSVSLRV